jgi:chromosome segregation ATPase
LLGSSAVKLVGAILFDGTQAEQQAKIAEQEDKIAEQEAKVSEQEAKISEQQAKISEQEAKIAEQQAKISEQQKVLHESTQKNEAMAYDLQKSAALLLGGGPSESQAGVR